MTINFNDASWIIPRYTGSQVGAKCRVDGSRRNILRHLETKTMASSSRLEKSDSSIALILTGSQIRAETSNILL